MPNLYPMILFGNTDTNGNWGTGGGLIIAAGNDPFGGTTGIKMSGSAGVSVASRTVAWARDGYQELQFFVSGGLATTTSSIELLNNVGGASVYKMYLLWNTTGCYSSSEAGATSANGQGFQPVQLGTSGWSLCRLSIASMSIALQAQLRFSPNINGAGTVHYYNRNTVFSGYGMYQPTAFSKPRDGSDQVQAASGDEDAWTVGMDDYLNFSVRWINDTAQDFFPLAQSGWFGAAPDVGVNVGWKSMLEAGVDKSVMRIVYNWYGFPGKYRDGYLFAPLDGAVAMESDWTKTVQLSFRSPSGSFEIF